MSNLALVNGLGATSTVGGRNCRGARLMQSAVEVVCLVFARFVRGQHAEGLAAVVQEAVSRRRRRGRGLGQEVAVVAVGVVQDGLVLFG